MHRREQVMERTGVRLHFRTEGTGPAVLLIHGWALDMDMWEPQFAALASAYRVVAFDRRGFGRSSGQPGIEDDLHDVQGLLDALALQQVAIIGMSQGARVALRYALQSPGRIACLVLDGPPDEKTPRHSGAADELPMKHYRDLVRQQGIEAFRQEWARHPFMQLQSSDPRTLELLRRIAGRYPGNDLIAAPAAYSLIADRLASLAVPALVINGQHDSPFRISAGAAMAKALPNARHSILPRAGHLPNLDSPAYNELICGFLRAHTRASASENAM